MDVFSYAISHIYNKIKVYISTLDQPSAVASTQDPLGLHKGPK